MADSKRLKDIKTMRVRKYFIDAAVEVIREDGIENATIRKVSDIAGYNLASVYNYFQSFEHLLTFASLKFLKPYTDALATVLEENLNALERYTRIFPLFAYYTFASPQIFFNLFYGKYGREMASILKEYYEIYPEELQFQSGDVLDMLISGDILERERYITANIYKEGFISEEDLPHLVEFAVWSHGYLLRELMQNPDTIPMVTQVERYENAMRYILRKMKLPGTPYVRYLDM